MKRTGSRISGLSFAADAFLLLAGGLTAAIMGVASWSPGELYLYSMNVLTIVDVCFFALFLLIETIAAFKISDSTWHTVFLAASLLCFHLTTIDFVRVTAGYGAHVVSAVAAGVNFFAFECSALALVLFWNYTYKLGFGRREWLPFAVWMAVCLAAYIPLSLIGLGVVAFALYAALFAATLFYICWKLFRAERADAVFFSSKAVAAALTGSIFTVELCNALGFPADGFPAFTALPVIVAFLFVYASFTMRTDRAALRASEYKLQYERIKARALREQIKPHFVFNVLAAIQSLYRVSPDEGDRATDLLSRHLRTNIEASDTDLIPFERELDNIQVYIDLENMRLSKKINVIFDIDFTDFQLPVLSLQPYIENAIKYSRVNEKEDGFIRITSRRTEEGVLLEVADNGVGFDVASIPATSCGIRNSSERFAMLMGVTPEIDSEIGKGTVVDILLKDDAGGGTSLAAQGGGNR